MKRKAMKASKKDEYEQENEQDYGVFFFFSIYLAENSNSFFPEVYVQVIVRITNFEC